MDLDDILRLADDRGASDVHLVPGHPPVIRVNTQITPTDGPPLTAEAIEGWVGQMVGAKQRDRLASQMDVDLSYAVAGIGRYRVNIHRQRGRLLLPCEPSMTRSPRLLTSISLRSLKSSRGCLGALCL